MRNIKALREESGSRSAVPREGVGGTGALAHRLLVVVFARVNALSKIIKFHIKNGNLLFHELFLRITEHPVQQEMKHRNKKEVVKKQKW